MNVRIMSALATGVVALAVAAPAQAAAPKSKFYFECTNEPAKAQNATLVQSGPQWTAEAPTASYTEGAGCGYGDAGALLGTSHESIYDGVFGGDFAGAIDDIDLELHNLVLSQVRDGATSLVNVRITVDGELWRDENVVVTPEASETGASELYKFTIADLEIPEGAEGRHVGITVNHDLTAAGIWVFGAEEIASNATLIGPDPDAPPAEEE
jgi:hypothetical protein